MTTNEPRALADLARANETIIHGTAVTIYGCGDAEIEQDDARDTFRIPEKHREAVSKALWQAPPSPDAGAYEAAVEKYRRAVIHEEDVRESTTDPHRQRSARLDTFAAKAALLAFAPGVRITATISESDVDAGAKALWKLVCGDDPQTDDDHAQTVETVRVVLEAVAAARQRATGSGVTGHE